MSKYINELTSILLFNISKYIKMHCYVCSLRLLNSNPIPNLYLQKYLSTFTYTKNKVLKNKSFNSSTVSAL